MTTASPAPIPAQDVQSFFDTLSKDYDAIIDKTFPPHREAFSALGDYLFLDRSSPLEILELGCGTGNLSLYLAACYPQARLTLLDLSPEMLKKVSGKIETKNYTLVEKSFLDADFPDNSFDLIAASIALHHLIDPDKAELYKRIFRWLKPGGQFRCADGVLTLPKELAHPVVQEQWANWSRQLGAQEEEIRMWREHERDFDHIAPLALHFDWLKSAGFTDVDCYWKKYLWAVFGGGKPA